MVPNLISDDIKSKAERDLFFEFRDFNTDEKYIVLHSLALSEHVNNIFGEIDFVIICSKGVLCIEVKGGLVDCSGGQWTFTNRYGKTNTKTEGPFQQVQGNMQSLRSYLVKRLGKRDALVSCQYASCVIMPDFEFTYRGIEVIPEILFDKSNYIDLADTIDRSFLYWKNLLQEKYGFSGSGLSDEDMERLSNLLRGDFRFVPSMKDTIDNTEKALCALTDDQYEILESLADNERTLVAGVAGAGKTFLAMEQARRTFWAGQSVLYICFNKNISGFVQYQLEKEGVEINVTTLHTLLAQVDNSDRAKDKYYFEEYLPQQFLRQREFVEYDFLIIDEGQDIFKSLYLQCLDKSLKGGLKNGCWFMLYDPNQNIYNDNREMDNCIQVLKKYPSTATFRLPVNCRNTKQIADANTLITGIANQGKSKISGLKVDYLPYENKEDERKLLDELLIDLRNAGICGNDIVILSKYSLSNPLNCLYDRSISRSAGILKTSGQMWLAKKTEVRFSTISSFKGLEAKTVIIFDVDAFTSQSVKLLNYVGISRASSKLYILYDNNKDEERQEMIRNYYSRLY